MIIKINDSILSCEIAKTLEQKILGLQFVNFLDYDSGMIFEFDKKQKLNFHTFNVKFGIDIIFISDNKIVKIVEAYPNNSNFECDDVNCVLEVNIGWCSANNIKIGNNLIKIRE